MNRILKNIKSARVVTSLFVFIPISFFAGSPTSIEFYLIFLPLVTLLSLRIFLLEKVDNKTNLKRIFIHIGYYLYV